METKDAIKHLSWKISFAKQCSTHWADCVDVDALEIAVRAMAEERKKGKWEDKEVFNETDDDHIVDEWQSARCSACGLYHTTPYSYYFYHYKYCPNCGADMRKEKDNE